MSRGGGALIAVHDSIVSTRPTSYQIEVISVQQNFKEKVILCAVCTTPNAELHCHNLLFIYLSDILDSNPNCIIVSDPP